MAAAVRCRYQPQDDRHRVARSTQAIDKLIWLREAQLSQNGRIFGKNLNPFQFPPIEDQTGLCSIRVKRKLLNLEWKSPPSTNEWIGMTVKACRHFGFDLQQAETWLHAAAVSYLIKVKMHCAMMKEICLKKTSVSNNLGWKKDATYWLLTQTCMLALEKCQILPFCPFQGHPPQWPWATKSSTRNLAINVECFQVQSLWHLVHMSISISSIWLVKP